MGSLSENSVSGSLFLFIFVPAVPSSNSLLPDFDAVFTDESTVSFALSATSFEVSTTASFTSFAFSLKRCAKVACAWGREAVPAFSLNSTYQIHIQIGRCPGDRAPPLVVAGREYRTCGSSEWRQGSVAEKGEHRQNSQQAPLLPSRSSSR